MTLLHILIVALVQGLTEFLPVSSSGHLVLIPAATGFDDQGQAIDVAVHMGTLGAVILYFWPDVRLAASGVPRLLRGRIDGPAAWLALCLAIATVPVIAAGLVLTVTGLADALRSVAVIGWTMIVFGAVLWWTDQRGPSERHAGEWTLKHAAIMGLWQALALIPGTSRSGITISAARHLGYVREDAARLAMLMSIPTILASGLVTGVDAWAGADMRVFRDGAVAAALAFLAALAALFGMMRLLRFVSFTPYVVYRFALGAVLLVVAYS